MNASEQVTDLLQALASAIADMPDPQKNASNPHFRNSFADLGEVMDCIQGPLHEHGLLVTQATTDTNVLVTRVWHAKSGQWIESRLALLLDKQTPQAQGSAITYARRYALKALFGMVDVDDDGEAASNRGRREESQKPQPKPATASRGPAPYTDPGEAAEAINRVETLQGLQQVGLRIAASPFAPEESAEIRALYAKRRIDLQAKTQD